MLQSYKDEDANDDQPDWRFRCRHGKNGQLYIHRYDNRLRAAQRTYTRVSVHDLPVRSKCFLFLPKCDMDPDKVRSQRLPCRKEYTVFSTRDELLDFIDLRRQRYEARIRLGYRPRLTAAQANEEWARVYGAQASSWKKRSRSRSSSAERRRRREFLREDNLRLLDQLAKSLASIPLPKHAHGTRAPRG